MTIMESVNKMVQGEKYTFQLNTDSSRGGVQFIRAIPEKFNEIEIVVLEAFPNGNMGTMAQTIKCLTEWWNEQNRFEK